MRVSTHAHTRSQTEELISRAVNEGVNSRAHAKPNGAKVGHFFDRVNSRAHAKLNDIGTSCIADYIKHDNYNVRI